MVERLKSVWSVVSSLWSIVAGVILGQLAIAGFAALYEKASQPGVPGFEPVLLIVAASLVVLRLVTFLIQTMLW